MRIDHVAIAVNNIDLALKNYEKLIRINKMHIENVAKEKVKVAILNLEDTRIELMEPTAQDSPINKFLNLNGEGLHHIAITADNIEEDVQGHAVMDLECWAMFGRVLMIGRYLFSPEINEWCLDRNV